MPYTRAIAKSMIMYTSVYMHRITFSIITGAPNYIGQFSAEPEGLPRHEMTRICTCTCNN